MKKHLFFFALLWFLSSICFAQWIPLIENAAPDSQPIVKLISDDNTGTIIKIELPGFRIKEFYNDNIIYHSIQLDEMAITNEVGFPEIPHIAKILAIPDLGVASIEILETSETQIIKGINIPPVRESWFEGEPESQYLKNNDSYNSEVVYPGNLARIEDPVIFRDFRIARVSIFPIRYSPAKQELEVISSITIKVKYGNGDGINPKLTLKKPIAPSFAKLYKSIIFNYDEVLQREYNGDELGYDLMLCIMPDSFVTSFQPYADWNHKTGTYIHITKFSEIGASGNNPTAVKNHILTTYNTWSVPPTHVLIIGDAGVAPHQNITLDGWTFAYDDYFVELAGNDYFPEMMIGRFTNQANPKLRAMRNKLINYEKIPYVTDPNWFRKGLVCSNDAYVSQIDTKRFTAQKMLVSGNFISVDSMYNGSPCPGNVTTISNMINAGRGWLNYRGEGWYTQWWADCFPYSTTQVNALTNDQKLTFVTSIGCGVANWVASGNNCFGEAWMEIGDENTPKGACAFIGPTSNTHTTYNNKIDMGIYMGMFDEGLDSPGEALLRGKFYMYEVFGGTDPYVGYHYRIYNVLGDPSLHIWKDTPRSISVSYTDTINVGSSQIHVIVTELSGGQPVSNAKVCISGDNIYVVGSTLSDGTVILNVNPQQAGELNIVVHGGKNIPFEGTIQVIEAATTFQLSVSVNNGWNMVSIPGLHPTDQNVNTWWAFRDLGANVFKYGGSGYVSVTSAIPGEGYWMKHSGVRTYNTGDEWPAGGIQIVGNNPINGFTGWNLIGGYENIAQVSGLTTIPPGLQSGPLYQYSSGYTVATTLNPGYGYWMKLSGPGQIIIPGTFAKGTETVEYFPKDWGRIILTDATGKNYTLYAAQGEVDLRKYELPPAPPSGMFDIRFSSGRIAEDINSSIQTINMSGVTYPITVRVEGMDMRLMDETGKTINVNLKSGENAVISDASIQKLIVTGEIIPAAYSLEQNYPNPFNPSTVIEFSLPEDVANVQLSIYNALGEKVAELVNTSLAAGKYRYEWNAQNVATGMYIYELRTEKFNAIKKMILLK